MKIPDVLKIGDTEYSVKDTPELMELIQSARKEEKDKLYAQIQNLESAKKTLEEEKKTSGKLTTEKEAELEAVRNELNTVKSDKEKLEEEIKAFEKDGKPKNEKKDDMTGLTREEVQKLVEAAIAEKTKEVSTKVDDVKKDITEKEISDYRKELLEKNKDVIIEKFVPTQLESKEAVDKAVTDALAESKKYIFKEFEVDGKKQRMTLEEHEAYEAKAKEAEEAEKARRTPTYTGGQEFPPKPDGSGGDLTDKDLLARLESMSDEEYAKHSDQILREARSLKYEPEGQ